MQGEYVEQLYKKFVLKAICIAMDEYYLSTYSNYFWRLSFPMKRMLL